MKNSRKRKPGIHKGGTDHNEKGDDDPEYNPSKNNTHHSLALTIFPLRPFLITARIHGRLGLNEAFSPWTVNTLAHPDDHSRIENASI